MEIKARLDRITELADGELMVTFIIPSRFAQSLEELKDKALKLVVSVFRKRRSLDANAYAWVLIDRIAAVTSRGKEEVYRELVRDVGGTSLLICVKDYDLKRVCRDWERNGLGWQTEPFPSELPDCTNVILTEGSSVFDVDQMRRFIDLIIQEAKQLGIETMTPEEINRLEGMH